MNTPSRPTPSSEGQRDQLERSERKAAEDFPENYQGKEASKKTVSTEQESADDVGSIKGIDNENDEAQGRKGS